MTGITAKFLEGLTLGGQGEGGERGKWRWRKADGRESERDEEINKAQDRCRAAAQHAEACKEECCRNRRLHVTPDIHF